MPRAPYKKPKKNISAAIPDDLSKEFNAQARARGFQIQRAVMGAIRMWVKLSPAEQATQIAGSETPRTEEDLRVEIRLLIQTLDDHLRKYEAFQVRSDVKVEA